MPSHTVRPTSHILQELGLGVRREGEELHGSAPLVPQMLVPGTGHLRTSILAAWTDTLAGLLAVDVIGPRVPVTLELDVHLYEPLPGSGTIHGVSRVVKAGRSVFVAGVDFTDDTGRPLAYGGGSFVTAPDPSLRLPPMTSVGTTRPGELRLEIPLAERARCERRSAGVAALPRTEDGLNSSKTVNGGLIALAAEEAVLSAVPGRTLSSLAMRYLQPVRRGPAVATAHVRDGLARIEVRDEGHEDRRSVQAVARLFGS